MYGGMYCVFFWQSLRCLVGWFFCVVIVSLGYLSTYLLILCVSVSELVSFGP